MPIYEYRCQQCNSIFSRLFHRPLEAAGPQPCSICGGVRTQRVLSSFAIGGRADPGPGRAAWPTSWNDTNGGDPETLNYWRHRIEREARLEEKYPELRGPALLNGKGTGESAPESVQHSHDDHHHHHHEHPHHDHTPAG